MNIPPIPALDPTPLPAPVWLFQVLLVVTFFVHILFLNVTLGGTLIATTHALLAKGEGAPGRRLGRLMASLLPAGVSFTVTTGVAPLLFIQLLYGQVFYAATVLVAWIWLAIVPLIVVGYYSVYLYKFEVGAHGGRTGWLGLAGLCFVVVAAILTLVNVLQLTPARWGTVATTVGSRCSGLDDPSEIPAFPLGLIGGGGSIFGRRGGGARTSNAGSLLCLVGPRGRRLGPGGDWPADGRRLLVPVLLAARSVDRAGGWAGMAHDSPGHRRGSGISGADPAVGTARTRTSAEPGLGHSRGVTGDRARHGRAARYGAWPVLSPIVRLRELPTQTQGDVTVLFFIVFLLGLATVGWMVRSVLRERHTQQ